MEFISFIGFIALVVLVLYAVPKITARLAKKNTGKTTWGRPNKPEDEGDEIPTSTDKFEGR